MSKSQTNNNETKSNIQSKFNYTVELGLTATKQALKLKKSTKDIVVNVLVIVFIGLMAGLLVWDIQRGESYALDLIILIALCAMEIFNLVMPFIILNMQKKFFKQVLLNEFDYTLTELDKDRCVESYYKDGKIKMQNSCKLSDLVAYGEKDGNIFLIFSNFATAIFDLNTLENATKEELLQKLEVQISKNKLTKKTKKS